MRVLVTGATGFIGRALAAHLLERGHQVRALVRPGADLSGLPRAAERAVGELERPGSLRAAVQGCQGVVHLAGAVAARRGRDFLRVNGEGSARLAEACAAEPRPPVLVQVSSLAASGPAIAGRPRTEEDLPAPVSRYGESKLAGERAVRALCGRLPASVVRPPVVYGPGDRAFLPALRAMARLGLWPRFARSSRQLSLVHVEDLCLGLAAVLERGERLGPEGAQGVYFLDGGPPQPWEEVARCAAAALGTRARFATLPLWLAWAAALAGSAASLLAERPAVFSLDKLRELRQAAWTCDGAKARRQLDLPAPRPLADGLRQALTGGAPEPLALAPGGGRGARG